MAPTSTAGRVAYVLAVSAVLIAVVQGIGHPSKFFWPLLLSLVVAVNAIQLYFVSSKPLRAVSAVPTNPRGFVGWVASPRGRSKLLRSTLMLVAFLAWLAAIAGAAAYFRGFNQ
jgi:hypothetical protein